MICPMYNGESQCGYKPKFFIMTSEHVIQCCTGNPADCATYKRHAQTPKEQPLSGNLSLEEVTRNSMGTSNFMQSILKINSPLYQG